MGGDIVYISSKNSVFAGPNNIAYSATKADQAHQVRLLAAELGEYGIRVNGINPDGVVRGSGIFAGGWGAKRAAVYGVRGSRTWASTTPSAPCSSAKSCPKTWPTPSPCSPAASSPTPPGSTSPWTPAWPPPSCDEPSWDEPSCAEHCATSGYRARRRPVRRECRAGSAFAAVDIGASSGRVILGRVAGVPAGPRAELETVHRFPNGVQGVSTAASAGTSTRCSPRSSPGWRPPPRRQRRTARRIASIGIDTWAVDYGLVNAAGELVAAAVQLPRRPEPRRRRPGSTGTSIRPGSTPPPGCSSCSSTRSTSSPAKPAWTGCRRCSSRTSSRSCSPASAAPRPPTPPPPGSSTPSRGSGPRSSSPPWTCPTNLFPPLIQPGETVGTLLPDIAARTGTSARPPRW